MTINHTPLTRDEILTVAQTLAVDAETAAVVTRLEAAGVKSILLRGPAIARRLYPGPGARTYVDADLLVEASRFAEAEDCLRVAGFAESHLEAAFGSRRPGHAHGWVSPSGRSIDLHRTLIGVGAPAEDVWSAFSDGADLFSVADTLVRVPAPSALGLIVALHAGHHAGRVDHTARDLELALDELPVQTWKESASLARRLDAIGLFTAGLRSHARGVALLKELGVDPPHHPHLELAGSRAFHIANDIASLRTIRGVRAKIRFVGSRLVPDPRSMRVRSQLARRGRVGLLLAYTLRWLRAVAQVPRAIAGLRVSARDRE